MIDKAKFYELIKANKLFVKLSDKQVQSMDFILNEWDKSGHTDLRWLAYMLATAYHETATTMQAINEYGKGKGMDYGRKLKMSRIAYKLPDKLYYGRGLVQLTWFENYELMGRLLRVDLLGNPDLALDLEIAVKIMFEGMLRGASSFGDFTGKCLEQFFNKTVDDPENARRIINGKDKAKLIAGYHARFLKSLVVIK